MTTFGDLIEATRKHVNSEVRDQKDRLAVTISDSDTEVNVDFEAIGIQKGARICIDLEEMDVWSANGGTVTVERGVGGTTAAAHTEGATIYVNPKVSTPSIAAALNNDIADLSAPGNGLYQVKTVDIVYSGSIHAYDLTGVTSIIDPLELTFNADDSTDRRLVLDQRDYTIRRSQPTDEFASGLALTINGWVKQGATMRLAYKAPFTAMANLADDVLAVGGLPASMHDIPPLGAGINLTAGGEIARNFLIQGDNRRAAEVPPGARSGSMRGLMFRREQRIAAERARLYAQYPVVRT